MEKILKPNLLFKLLCLSKSFFFHFFVGNDDNFHPAVFGPANFSIVISDRLMKASALCFHSVACQPLGDGIIFHRKGPSFRKSLIVLICTPAVGMSDH